MAGKRTRALKLLDESKELSKQWHVSPYQLKQQIVAGKSLGKAIYELNPDVDAKAEARKAQKQAKRDIRESRP